MKKLIFAAVIISSLASTTLAIARDQYVKGHYRSNGTYVQPHYKTAPDSTIDNNYSTKGNVNPYTGKEGTVNPYKAQKYNNGGYYNKGYNR